MRQTRLVVGGVLLLVVLAVAVPAAVIAGPDEAASVQFGNTDVGSPGPVGPGIVLHDASANAEFNLVPRTVVVAAGGTVTFTVGVAGATGNNIVPHQVAVCRLGTTLDDVVDTDLSTVTINDPDCPVVGPVPPSPSATVQKTFTGTGFNEPGRYLVICNLRPHFTEFNMYGWINVK